MYENLDAGAKDLHKKMEQLSLGFDNDQKLNAAYSMIICIMREKRTWPEAERLMSEMHGRVMSILKSQFDADGRKRRIVPFHYNNF
jgi:hypothetical protein